MNKKQFGVWKEEIIDELKSYVRTIEVMWLSIALFFAVAGGAVGSHAVANQLGVEITTRSTDILLFSAGVLAVLILIFVWRVSEKQKQIKEFFQ